jgi:chromosome segregation ATPase
MASQQVINALEELHQELNKLEPAIKHIETAQQVTQTVKDIPKKHLELINDLKALFAEELKGITTENKNISKTTSELQTEVRKELEDLSKLRQAVAAFHDKVIQINFPERLDKLDANVAGIMAAIQSTQSRLDNVERNLSDKMRDLSDRQKEEMIALKNTIETNNKKQQTLTYITWALIVGAIITIIILK